MATQIEPGAGEIHRQADGLVGDVGRGEGQERPEHQVVQLEPELADDQAAGAYDQDHGQVAQVPVDVAVLLDVVWRQRKDQSG